MLNVEKEFLSLSTQTEVPATLSNDSFQRMHFPLSRPLLVLCGLVSCETSFHGIFYGFNFNTEYHLIIIVQVFQSLSNENVGLLKDSYSQYF